MHLGCRLALGYLALVTIFEEGDEVVADCDLSALLGRHEGERSLLHTEDDAIEARCFGHVVGGDVDVVQ